MTKSNLPRFVLAILFILSVHGFSRAQSCANSPSLTECINARVVSLVKAKTDQNSNTKQAEAPSISGNSTSLVDQSSATDLVGVAMNLAGLSGSSQSNDSQPNSISVTTTAYALYSAFKGVDPLNPDFYNKHRDWRRFSITLGYDNEKKLNSDQTQRVSLYGAKVLLINRRDPNRKQFEGDLNNIRAKLDAATQKFGFVSDQLKTFIFKNELVMTQIVEPDFKSFLERRKNNLDHGVLAASNIRLAAQSAVSDRAGSPQPIVAAVNQQAQTTDEIVRTSSRDAGEAINAANIDARKAVLIAAAIPGATAGSVADAAVAAHQKAVDQAAASKAHLDELAGENVRTLFVFERGLLSDNSDKELRRFNSEFISNYTTGSGFVRIKTLLGADLDAQIDKALKDLGSFTELREVSLNTIDKIRRAPQLSLAYFTKQRPEGIDEHKGEIIFDWGIANKLNLTANGAFVYNDSKVIGGDTRGASFSAQFRYQVNRNDAASLLSNKTPVYFDVSAEGKVFNGQNSTITAQAKLTIPLGNTGIQLPLSVSVANRTELIKEKDVRGQFGFTFDLSKIVSALAQP